MPQKSQSKSFLALPESKKYPRIFKLKTVSLIVLILITIVGIIDLILFLYIRNNREPSANISFVNQIVRETEGAWTGLKNGSQVRFLVNGLLKVYPEFYWQFGEKVAEGDGRHLTAKVLRQNIFKDNGDNILFLLHIKDQLTDITTPIAIFTSSPFPIPKPENYSPSTAYYTFDSSTTRKAVLLSLNKKQYLIMNGTSQLEAEDLLKCKIYVLAEEKGYFEVFGVLRKGLDGDGLSLGDLGERERCFWGVKQAGEIRGKIETIFGFAVEGNNTRIVNYEVYRLKNSLK